METLTGATLSWKTELNRSISAMEDRISRGLQHRHKICCEKGGHYGRQACMVQRWHHRRDVVFQIGGLAYDTSDKHKKYLINNLYLYCSAKDHKLDFCSKKQTTVIPKGYSATVTADLHC